MKLSRRAAFACAFCAAGISLVREARAREAPAREAPARNRLTPGEAMDRLLEGNRRFAADAPPGPMEDAARREALVAGQAPFAAVLGCADSRTPPELLFRAQLGEMFTVRVAGNSLSEDGLGSLEFAANALGVSVILVVGHERCGAATAAIQMAERGMQLPGALMAFVNPILPAVAEARRGNPADLLDATIRIHARRTAGRLREALFALSPALAAGSPRVQAGYYALGSGQVTLLEG